MRKVTGDFKVLSIFFLAAFFFSAFNIKAAATDEDFDSISPQIVSATDSFDFSGSDWSFIQNPPAQLAVAGMNNGSAFTNGLSSDYPGDLVLFMNYNNVTNVDSFAFHLTDYTNFKLVSFQLGSNIAGSNLSVTVSMYLDNGFVGSGTFDLNSSSSSNGITFTYEGNSGSGSDRPYGTLTFDETYQNVNEIRLQYGGTATPLIENIDVSAAILPVELTSFTARFDKLNEQQNCVVLNWQTATEVNNYGFEIERTSPLPSPYQGEGGEAGRGWETLGFVEGAGNSNSVKSYSFNDNLNLTLNPNLTLTYRLKQIDLDGKFTYSKEIEVSVENVPSEFALEQNYPNPFNPATTIKYSLPEVETLHATSVQLKIYNLLGQEVATLVNKQQSAGNYEVKFDASNLASGIYLYKLQAGDFSSVKKLMLLK